MSAHGMDAASARIFLAVDHAAMLDLIDGIETAMTAAEPDLARISADLEELVTITRLHFEREGEIMACLSEEEADAHRRDHRYLLKALVDYAITIRAGGLAVSAKSAIDLDTWLMFHIQRFDTELVAAMEGRLPLPA